MFRTSRAAFWLGRKRSIRRCQSPDDNQRRCNKSAPSGPARCPQRVAALVYVAAFLPKDGQSLLDLTKLPEGDGEPVLANVVVEGEPPAAVMPAAASRHALYGSCAEDVATWAIARQCPQPVSALPIAVSIPPRALNG